MIYIPRWEDTLPELAIYGWFVVLVINEVFQLATSRGLTLKAKVRAYFTNIWNMLDVLMIVTAVAAVILRNFQATFWVRINH